MERRLTSESESAIRACLRHQCSACRRLRVPGPPPAGSLPPDRDFGDLVGVDLFELADTNGRRQLFLNAVDLASRLQIVGKVGSKSPSVAPRGLMQSWIG